MDNLLGSAVSGELIFVYGLITVVVILIIVIVAIDRRESKKKPKNLFDTLNMKIIADPTSYSSNNKTEEKEVSHSEIIEVEQRVQKTSFQDLEPLPEFKINSSLDNAQSSFEYKETLAEAISSIEEEPYVESELEKTQAQIRVEEITEALERAKIEEQLQEDKYTKFEEEQEKNAIISYRELKESFDRLYSENEKIQYLEDDGIPINIDELYQFNSHQEEKKVVEPTKVKLEDLSNFTTPKTEVKPTSTFKCSPLISPVYGIQKPPVEVKTTVDTDIQNANQFLQSLKELKNNLD